MHAAVLPGVVHAVAHAKRFQARCSYASQSKGMGCMRLERPRGKHGRLCVRADGDNPKMWVPPDAFGGTTPERKAAGALRSMHTYIAAHIVAGQLMNLAPRINTFDGTQGGSGAEGAAESGRVVQGYDVIMTFLEKNPVKDGDDWLKKFASEAPLIAARIATVRLAYCSQDFEWDVLKRLCVDETKAANVEIMRNWAASMYSSGEAAEEEGGAGGREGGGGAAAPSPPPPPAAQ